jgi:hypothetical protein
VRSRCARSRFDTCDYSLDPRLAGRRVEVRASQTEVWRSRSTPASSRANTHALVRAATRNLTADDTPRCCMRPIGAARNGRAGGRSVKVGRRRRARHRLERALEPRDDPVALLRRRSPRDQVLVVQADAPGAQPRQGRRESTGSTGSRAAPNGSRPALPTVHNPKVTRFRVGASPRFAVTGWSCAFQFGAVPGTAAPAARRQDRRCVCAAAGQRIVSLRVTRSAPSTCTRRTSLIARSPLSFRHAALLGLRRRFAV